MICAVILFGLSTMYALNKLNTERFNKQNTALMQSNVTLAEDKLTLFGLDVLYYRLEKIDDSGAYEVIFEKSQLYEYVPFIFAGVVTLVVTVLFLISYSILNRRKRSC